MEGDKAQNVKPDAKEKDVVKDAAKDAKEKKKEEAELSEEDRKLKTDLEMLVERLKGSDTALHRPSLETIRNEIRQSTSSVTAVPKPLKFLRPHFDTLKGVFTSMTDPTDKALASDVLSLLATTFEGNREALHYRLTGTSDSLGSWGHDYVRHLQGEIADEFQDYMAADPPKDVSALIKLADEMVAYDMKHNSEADACDLLMELDRLDTLIAHVDAKSYERVCLYLFSCVPYVPEPADANLLKICMQIFRKFEQWPQCLQMAMKLNDIELVKDVFRSCKDKSVRRQLAFMLGRQQIWFDLDEEDLEDDERVVLKSVISNSRLSENFLSLARELDIMEPKAPEDIYKTHLESYRGTGGVTVDSARGNLASAFVNAFVNSGFCVDKLVLTPPKANEWIYKNKDHGMMSATASLGMLMLWSVEDGLGKIDAHMFSDSEYVRAGALLAVGILNAGVRDENEPAMALLTDFVTDPKPLMRVGANMGLGLAYAGSANATVRELLENSVKIADDLEARAMAALALGQVYVGTCEPDIAFLLIDLLTNLSDKDLESPHARFIALGLGLLFLGKQKEAEVTLEILSTLKNPFKKIVTTLVEVCAYAGTGNVLKVQKLLHVCSEHVATKKDAEKAEEAKKEAASAGAAAGAAGDATGAGAAGAGAGAGDDAGNNPDAMAVDDKKEDEDEDEVTDTHQAFAVLGIALIGMAEEIGRDMAIRSFNHLLQYGEPVIRRAVPIGLAMLCVSNPLLPVLDTLSKLSHDPDAEVAYNSILAMGLVGAGTNQARIAGMLRQLAQYYSKDPNGLFVVRVAQGILHTGKGSITLSPYHTERTLMSPVAVSGLLAVLVSALDIKRVLLDKQHFMLYHLCLAMQPRILSTFHEDLTPAVTSVRVGLAVDVVGQAGKPKTITGFVTHNTPVLLGFGERAQLATEEYLPLTPMLEGFVILRKNPDFEKHD